jgi:drug/metabolite transporter (DMT)-like permease
MSRGIIFGILAGALWGLVFITPQMLSTSSPLDLAVGRYLAYGSLSSLVLFPNAKSLMSRLRVPDYFVLLRHALAGSFVYYVLLALGVKYAGVASTSIIIGLIPLLVAYRSRKEDDAPPLRHMALPLVLMIASITALNIEALSKAQARDSIQLLGIGLACAAGALWCWSWYAIDNARYLKRNPQFTSAQWSALYGVASGIVALVIGIAAECASSMGSATLSHEPLRFWMCNLAVALLTSVVANQLWNITCRLVPVSLSVQLASSETLFAIAYGAAFNGRALRNSEWLAICLLTLSITAAIAVHAKHASR